VQGGGIVGIINCAAVLEDADRFGVEDLRGEVVPLPIIGSEMRQAPGHCQITNIDTLLNQRDEPADCIIERRLMALLLDCLRHQHKQRDLAGILAAG
jgi:hypothetical protein